MSVYIYMYIYIYINIFIAIYTNASSGNINTLSGNVSYTLSSSPKTVVIKVRTYLADAR